MGGTSKRFAKGSPDPGVAIDWSSRDFRTAGRLVKTRLPRGEGAGRESYGTATVAEPPPLLFTVTLAGLVSTLVNVRWYRLWVVL